MSVYDPTETYRKVSFRNIPHQVRLRKIERILKTAFKEKQVKSFIDIGCASGFITHRLKGLLKADTVRGTDAVQEYITAARSSYPEISFDLMDLNKEIEQPGKYDLVTCFETLEHVGHLDTALQNIHRSIAKNGMALLSVPIEVGVIGTIKYLLKVKVYGDKFNEIGPANQKKYFRSLLRGEDISIYRQKQKDLWWDHFGFNYRVIEAYLRKRNIRFKGITSFTTRFILIYN
jgi:2-polyprenyl-3-methyl-5-hydroxy-6-metoxy-1,4-benzoquinol methylase